MDVVTLRERVATHVENAPTVDDPAQAALAAIPDHVVAKVYSRPLTPAAVLIPLSDLGGELSLLLTQRTDHLKDHPGQISFPGGSIENADSGPIDAALRESQEEIGLPRTHVEVVGTLAPHAVITGFAVTPVVGLINRTFDIRLDEFEVAEVFEVPLAFFLDPGNQRKSLREIGGTKFPMFEYHYQHRRIWGATAGIIQAFTNILIKTNG